MKLSFQRDQLGAFSILAWAIGLLLAFIPDHLTPVLQYDDYGLYALR